MKNKETISTYVINLPERQDRLAHIEKQFEGREEFCVTVIKAISHEIGNFGLWESIKAAVNIAVLQNKEVIIVCEDDHMFTTCYNKELLVANICFCQDGEIDLLIGGIGGCSYAMPVTKSLFWVEDFICTQFLVIYKRFFSVIQNSVMRLGETTDGKLSGLTKDKLVISPFISVQREFGYSDIDRKEDRPPISGIFDSASSFFEKMGKIYAFYAE